MILWTGALILAFLAGFVVGTELMEVIGKDDFTTDADIDAVRRDIRNGTRRVIRFFRGGSEK
jgi:hypothetical protein